MTAAQLIAELEQAGVYLWEESGQLRFRAPKGVITAERLATLKELKDDVLVALRDSGLPTVTADPERALDPFPLTDVQTAYLLGRSRRFAYGGIACHMYVEVDYAELDPVRLEQSWNRLIGHHDMLRAIVHEDGSQQVLADVPHYAIHTYDVRTETTEGAALHLDKVRDELGHQQIDTAQWPLFDLRLTRAPERSVLHVSIDFLLADWASIQMLLDQLEQMQVDPDYALPQHSVTFRDYVLTERGMRDSAQYQLDRDYWMARIDELPPAPELPVTTREDEFPTFVRHELHMDATRWGEFRKRAGAAGVTASGAVLAAYAEVIGMWARRPDFTINLTLLNRLPLHDDVATLVGDFTSVTMLEVRPQGAVTFAQRAQRLGQQLFDDMDHRLFTGIEVIREVARRRSQGEALMPVVFTGSIGAEQGSTEKSLGTLSYGISQTPQLWIDCQALERDGALLVNWDVRREVFPDGLVETMFATFEELIGKLADADATWAAATPVPMPAAQLERRAQVNATAGPVPQHLLHEPVLAAAAAHPERIAVVDTAGSYTYDELLQRVSGISAALTAAGTAPGDVVAIALDKCLDQIASVLAVLAVGGVYLPIDPGQPAARRDRILADSGAARCICAEAVELPVSALVVTEIATGTRSEATTGAQGAAVTARRHPDDLAYIIYTSGSTGTPKGVMISHRGAANTVADISERYGIGADDRVLGLANLGFDLSVYDIFGALSLGATLVLPDPQRRGDPTHWAEVVARHGVTVWNSVPAQLQMLSLYLASPGAGKPEVGTLRVAMLSGDWIPVTLPDEIRAQIPCLRVISMGGATEASIWSIYYEIGTVDPDAASIPYGYPLRNQSFHVLDHELRERPEWVAGELYIGGVGVAMGYRNDPERTAQRFLTHPRTGEKLYRTGDFGRYLPSGAIEFLGREDDQVKIRGHRIELAEVEAAVLSHPQVSAAMVLVDGADALRRRLAAFVVCSTAVAGADTGGTLRASGAAERAAAEVPGDLESYLREHLPSYMVPSVLVGLDAIPVTANGKVDRAALAARLAGLTAAEAAGGDEPHAGLETTLAQLWAEVLKIERVGRNDDFFAMGGNSLLSTQLVAKVRERIPQAASMYFDTLVRELLPEPTVAAMARYLAGVASEVSSEPVRRQVVSPMVPLGHGTEDPVVLLVHDGTGKFYNFAELPPLLDPNRKVLGLTAGDADTYLKAAPGVLLARRVSAYARLVRTERPGAVQVAGFGSTAVLALELARALTTGGVPVQRVVLLDPYRLTADPGEVALEYLFAREIGVAPAIAGLPESFAQVPGAQPAGTRADRIAAIGAAVQIATDLTAASRFEIFCRTTAALYGYRVQPYTGPVHIVGAPEPGLDGLVAELRAGGIADVTEHGADAGMTELAELLNGAQA